MFYISNMSDSDYWLVDWGIKGGLHFQWLFGKRATPPAPQASGRERAVQIKNILGGVVY